MSTTDFKSHTSRAGKNRHKRRVLPLEYSFLYDLRTPYNITTPTRVGGQFLPSMTAEQTEHIVNEYAKELYRTKRSAFKDVENDAWLTLAQAKCPNARKLKAVNDNIIVATDENDEFCCTVTLFSRIDAPDLVFG